MTSVIGKHIADIEHRQCYSCKSFITRSKLPGGRYKTPLPLWHHLQSDNTNWYCNICYTKDRYQKYRTQLISYQIKYHKKHRIEIRAYQRKHKRNQYKIPHVRTAKLLYEKRQVDKNRKLAFRPRKFI